MAFVYCDPRWKEGNDNQIPGPGNYEVVPTDIPQKKKSSHHRSANFKRSIQPASKEQENAPLSKTHSSQQKMYSPIDQIYYERKESQKRGKLYRKTAGLKQEQFLKKNDHNHKLQIKNGEKINSEAVDKDRWGNMKIIELLKEHKDKQVTKISIKKGSISSKRNVFTYHDRQKWKTDLKQMQILFNSHRNRNDTTLSVKNIHRQISSKQKQRQNNSHNYFTTLTRTGTAAKEQKINQELTVQPSAIYKSPVDEATLISRPQTAEKDNTPAIIEYSKYGVRQEMITTGLSDDLMEDSIEYIEDATPGPGYYDLNVSSASGVYKQYGKKIQKFGVTMQRFKVDKNKTRQAQSLLTPSYPDFKKSSQARQQAVGFGRGTKQQREAEGPHNGAFYQDINNLENATKKAIMKGKNKKVGFQSSQSRFPYASPKRESSSSQQEIQYEDSLPEENQQPKIPSCVFLSKVQRQVPATPAITVDVDFTGQNYKCLAHQLKKQKEFYEDYEIKPAPFMVKDNRFKYEEPKEEEKKEELKLIKIKQLKQKKENKQKKTHKGFTFGKQIKKDHIMEECPSPDKYEVESEWIKKTYNLRFR